MLDRPQRAAGRVPGLPRAWQPRASASAGLDYPSHVSATTGLRAHPVRVRAPCVEINLLRPLPLLVSMQHPRPSSNASRLSDARSLRAQACACVDAQPGRRPVLPSHAGVAARA